jgi:hypothetical protein
MRDPFKVLGSIFTATILCLIAATAAQADGTKSGEIIETDFAPAPFSSDGQSPPAARSSLPDAVLPLQPVPAELIGDFRPADPHLQPGRSGGGDVASSDGGASNDSGGSGSGDGGSGGGGSGGSGSGDGGSGSGDSGGGSGGGGHGNGHGKGGSKK